MNSFNINGCLLKLPVEQIYAGAESRARNQRIQNMLRMIGYGENIGSGFPLILKAWDPNHWLKPELFEQPELMQVRLVLTIEPKDVGKDGIKSGIKDGTKDYTRNYTKNCTKDSGTDEAYTCHLYGRNS